MALTADELEADIRQIGGDLADAFPSTARHPLRTLDTRAMDLAARDRELRAALFRFVDVVPACRSLDDVARHLRDFLDEVPERPPPLAAAMRISDVRAARAAVGAAAAAGVKHMAHRFIVGETPASALRVLRGLWDHGVASSVDLLGEATVTTSEADRYATRCVAALEEIAAESTRWPARPVLERDSVGVIPRTNVSVKVSALTPLLKPDAPELGQRDAAARLRPLLRRADELGAYVHIDMESLDSREAVLDLVLDVLSEPEFASGPSAGMVLQAYLRDSPEQLDRVLAWTQSATRDVPLTVRLVKGAYWDHELVEARQEGWPVPVFEDKADCDRNFEELTRTLLDARPFVRVAVASHNLRSVSHAIAVNRLLGGQDADLELQVLRGLGDDLQEALAAAGLVIQAYLRDSGELLDQVLEFAQRGARRPPLQIRLVKGAYWDHELVEARQHGWQSPVYEAKADSDRNFEALTRRLLDARPHVRVAIASHNLRSVAHAIAYNRATGGLDSDLEIQVLRGLGDELAEAVASLGLRVRSYCPIGNLVAGMAYLVRRLLENTSNDSFLNAQAHGAALDELLGAP